MTQNVSKPAVFLGLAAIALVSFGVYLNTLNNSFVYDDTMQVLQNSWIRDVRNLPEIFSKSAWGFQSERAHSNYYRPLMHIFYMIDYHLFGLNPRGFHLVNVLFHTANSLLIFFVASSLLRESETGGRGWEVGRRQSEAGEGFTFHDSRFIAFLAAILFATHPVHTEAVAWVGAITDLSYSFFFLLSFYFYIECGMEIKRREYLFSLIAFFLALLCKEPAVSLPLVLFAYDIARGKGGRGLVFYLKRYIPFVLIAGVYFIARFHALEGIAPVKAHRELTSYQYVINIFSLFSVYVEKLLLPLNLNAFHTLRPVSSLLEIRGIISLAITISYLIFGIVAYRKDRISFLGLALVGAPLLPALYIPALGESPLAERYLYLPSAGFILVIASFCLRPAARLRRYGFALTAAAILLAGLYSIQTVSRNRVWKDNLTLFSDTVKRSPDGELPHGKLGNALVDLGRIDEAIEQYRFIILNLNPNSPEAHRNLGLSYMKKGMKHEAIKEYLTAVTLAPADIEARRGLVLAYEDAGLLDEAIGQYRILLDLTPRSAETHYRLAGALSKNGMAKDAISHYLEALQINPDYVDAHYNLGTLYANSGQMNEAVPHFEAAVRLKPDDAFYRNVLGITYGRKGRLDEAVEQFQSAVRLNPSEPAYRRNLEKAQAMKKAAGKDT